MEDIIEDLLGGGEPLDVKRLAAEHDRAEKNTIARDLLLKEVGLNGLPICKESADRLASLSFSLAESFWAEMQKRNPRKDID